ASSATITSAIAATSRCVIRYGANVRSFSAAARCDSVVSAACSAASVRRTSTSAGRTSGRNTTPRLPSARDGDGGARGAGDAGDGGDADAEDPAGTGGARGAGGAGGVAATRSGGRTATLRRTLPVRPTLTVTRPSAGSSGGTPPVATPNSARMCSAVTPGFTVTTRTPRE